MTDDSSGPRVDSSDWECLRDVLAEAARDLDSVEPQLLGRGVLDPAALDRAFGSFRAVKLVASSLCLEPIANLARTVEAEVDRTRRGGMVDPPREATVHAVASARRLLCVARRPTLPPPAIAAPPRKPARRRRKRRT